MSLRSKLWPAGEPSGAAKPRRPVRLSVEPLEDRAVPAVFVVQTLADGGASDGGTDGEGVGGGLYLAPGGFVTADPWTFIFWNDASTSDDDMFGEFNDLP